MNRRITLCSLLVVCFMLAVTSIPVYAANAGVLKVEEVVTNIFDPVKDNGDTGDHVHGSSIVELPNGELLSVWFQGNGERDATTTRIMGARSLDGGKTWKTPFVVEDAQGIADINPVVYMDSGDRLWFFWYPVLAGKWSTSQTRYAYAEKGSYEYDQIGNKKPVWTFSEVINVKIGMNIGDAVNPDSPDDYISPRLQKGFVNTLKAKFVEQKAYIFKPIEQGGAGVSQRVKGAEFDALVTEVMQLAGGDPNKYLYAPTVADSIWKGRSGYPLARRIGWQTKDKPYVIPLDGGKVRMILPLYSDTMETSIMAITEYNPAQPLEDNSIHWEFSEPIVGVANIQATMAQRKDGTLVAYMRDNGPRPYRVLYAESKDGGFTWTIAKDVAELQDPGVGHDLLQLKNGNWVFVHVDTESTRNTLAVALSDDEGKTWKYRRHLVIDTRANLGSYHYPAVTQGKNGDILVTFSRFFTGDDRNASGESLASYKNIVFSRLTEDWIKQGDWTNPANKLVREYESIDREIAVPASFNINTASDSAIRAILPSTIKAYLTYAKGASNATLPYVDLPVNWDLNAIKANYKLNTYISNNLNGTVDEARLPAGITTEMLPVFKPSLKAYFYNDSSAVAATGVSLDNNTISLAKGQSAIVKATVAPSNASNKTVLWSTSDANVATVSNGIVTASGKGTAVITAQTLDGGLKATATVDVKIAAATITLDPSGLSLFAGQTAVLKAAVAPEDTSSKALVWSTSDPTVATVNDGTVTAVNKGNAIITVQTQDGSIKATAIVEVKIAAAKVSLEPSELNLLAGQTAVLKATVAPDDTSSKALVWSTSDASVATVNDDGTVTAVNRGNAVITAAAQDGSLAAGTAVVTVRYRSNSSSGSGSSSSSGTTVVTTPTDTPADETKQPEQQPESTASQQPIFKDLTGYSWAQEAIQALASKGIVNGTSDQTFDPGKNISRADILTMLVRALGLKAAFTSNFDDVKKDDYFYEALGISKALGITNGVDDNKYLPSEAISRQDLMVLIARALNTTQHVIAKGTINDLKAFKDASSIADYAVESIASLVKAGIIEGSDNMINPNGKATRAEVAAILFRILNHLK
ncbi:Ig-like domain-containing protein [Paenibacillus periandrae]|uniref:Ig-like domain-containing protein n=1 Tax=Paenibacillus periandrae TaxID=1761741 RepID=UPI001F08A2F5|nr:Ig-like domain-containing protein [Paenibacillus periandrae]